MDRFGLRRVVGVALLLVSAGSGLTVFMTASWQLVLCWGVLVGLGTGSMALAFVATVTSRWFVRHRGLVTGILTAGGATGQLIFLPVLAAGHRRTRLEGRVADGGRRAHCWSRRSRSGCCATTPATSGVQPYGGTHAEAAHRPTRSRRMSPDRPAARSARCAWPHARARSGSSSAASPSAAPPRTAWSARTSSRPPTITACRRPRPRACSRSSACSTSSARSSPAG